MTVRPMMPSDLENVARVHKLAYKKDHFTSRFSPGLLKKFYETILQYNPYCYILETGSATGGFIVAGEKTNYAVSRFTKEHMLQVGLTLLLNPVFLKNKLLGMLGKKDSFVSKAPLRLLSIAINPEMQSKGAGKTLITYFENELVSKGEKQYGLSVHKNNSQAISFYNKTGFSVEHDTGEAYYYIKHLV